MTRKDYKLIAQTLHAARVHAFRGELVKGGELEYVMHRLATEFAAENPRFDADRFIYACVEGGR